MVFSITYRPPTGKVQPYIPVVVFFFIFFSAGLVCAQDNRTDTPPEKKFSRAERRWAVRWINRELALCMGKGIVTKISTKGAQDRFDVFVGEKWYGLSFSTRGKFLKNLSRAREITEHKPFFNIYDDPSRQVAARVSHSAIMIRLPGEGFFEYLYTPEEERKTRY